jgi:hypothetical protein
MTERGRLPNGRQSVEQGVNPEVIRHSITGLVAVPLESLEVGR